MTAEFLNSSQRVGRNPKNETQEKNTNMQMQIIIFQLFLTKESCIGKQNMGLRKEKISLI